MTQTHIDQIVETHLNRWFADGVSTPGDGKRVLRDRCADMIREALKLRDKQWEDGNATLRHERDAAKRDTQRLDWLDEPITFDDSGERLVAVADIYRNGASSVRIAIDTALARTTP